MDDERFKTEAIEALVELLKAEPCEHCGEQMDMGGFCQEGCPGVDAPGRFE